jgi:hypothetical protein
MDLDLGRLAPASEVTGGHTLGPVLTILERAWSANFKMVWYVLRPLRPELDGQDPFQLLGFCVKLEKRRL